METVSQKLQYLGVLILLLVSLGLVVAIRLSSWVLSERGGTSPLKGEAFECGVPLLSPARLCSRAGFQVLALLFLLFQAATALVLPWALALAPMRAVGQAGWWGALMLAFLGMLLSGWFYCSRKGALDWET